MKSPLLWGVLLGALSLQMYSTILLDTGHTQCRCNPPIEQSCVYVNTNNAMLRSGPWTRASLL